MTWNTITGLTGGKQVDMGMYDPKIVDFALESDDGGTEYAFTGYGLKISATTINGNGNDGRTDASEYYTFSEDKQMSVDEILDKVRAWFADHDDLDVAVLKTLLGLSRKYLIALLEYMDREKITVRVGDKRQYRGR